MRLPSHSRLQAVNFLCLVAFPVWCGLARADWPALHGNAQHTGFTSTELRPPFRLAWATEFDGERLGTAMEPIVADGRVFVATHAGHLYALQATNGEPIWRFAGDAPFLQSPAIADGVIVAANAGGGLFALDAATGVARWRTALDSFAASPTIADGRVFIGSRNGRFFGVALADGAVRWQAELGVPVRQTAAAAEGRVWVTAEDLRVRCFDAATGRLRWTSPPLAGQSARDYYPVVVAVGGKRYVVVRTNPALNMAQRIARDRSLLARNAGADDSDWRKLDAWLKSDAAHGTPDLWAREQQVVQGYLHDHPDARTFFVLDAETDEETPPAPVLWAAGCQGVGTPPALTADGHLLVFNRSAYGNWNHGVAPLVALGLLDLAANRIAPLFHTSGPQPPWNTFWGTADESQNFVVAGHLALITHQGTLSGFDLESHRLFTIHGERDSYGGFRNPPWARNEWHGPGRGGVAVAGNRLFWLTGSRVLCLAAGESGAPAKVKTIAAADVKASAPTALAASASPAQLQSELEAGVREFLSQRWAPLLVEPGLAGREFFYADSGEAFAALAWAYPHLSDSLQAQVRDWLATEWTQHPPFSARSGYDLREGAERPSRNQKNSREGREGGEAIPLHRSLRVLRATKKSSQNATMLRDSTARREWFAVPDEELSRLGSDRPAHPFGNLYAVRWYAERVGERTRVLAAWPELKACFADWQKSGWRLDGTRGDLYANRYLASLLAFAELARAAGDAALAQTASIQADAATAQLVAWWRRAAAQGTLSSFAGAGQLDPFIGGGDALSFKVAPHRHKLALFRDLTPEVADRVLAQAPEAVDAVWRTFTRLYATWWLVGEERQVHFGENFVDPPDLALGGFQALAWLRGADAAELARRVDLPFARADLYALMKEALALDASRKTPPVR